MKKRIVLGLLIAIIVTGAAFAQQWVTDLPTNVNVAFQTTRASATSRDGFLSPTSNNPRNMDPIQLRDMNGNEPTLPHRLFQLVHLGDGWYQIKNNANGLLLDVNGNRNVDNLQLMLYQQNNDYNSLQQRFRIARVGDGLYQIYTSGGRNLHAQNGGTANGTRVVTMTGSSTDSNPNAIWRIYTVDNQGRFTQWPQGAQPLPPVPTPTASIDGMWRRSDGMIFVITGSTGVNTSFATLSADGRTLTINGVGTFTKQ